jgi:hypothetical protein
MSGLYHDPVSDEDSIQDLGGRKSGATPDSNSVTPGRLTYTSLDEAPAHIARKVSPRFASRLKNRLSRL